MANLEKLIAEIECSFHDSGRLAELYGVLVKELLASPLWSPSLDGRRIPWRSAATASNHSSMKAVFDSPGIYLFGTAAGLPRYIGITMGRKSLGTFRKRMRRYLWGSKSQCELASAYEKELCTRGIDGFPSEIRKWYRKNYGNSTVRLKGAIDFAKHGIDGVWVVLLPIQRKELILAIEEPHSSRQCMEPRP